MTRIEKRHGPDGTLVWASGPARDIYQDEEILDSKCAAFRIAGEARLYRTIIPRHCASNILGEEPTEKALDDMVNAPFKEWRFVMVGYVKSIGTICEVAREISGDTLVEYVKAEKAD
jgi:hypothetical protein